MTFKLIKINPKHYIIVDDSEVKEGDWYYWEITKTIQIAKLDSLNRLPKNSDGSKKITHSTQPLESMNHGNYSSNVYLDIEKLSLQEVKELIGEVDVEKKAQEYTLNEVKSKWGEIVRDAFKFGYNQALEDNRDKKYTEEDMKECVMSILRDLNTHNEIDKPVNFVWTDSFKKHIQSLQPKTEWEVEFVDGKLKLK